MSPVRPAIQRAVLFNARGDALLGALAAVAVSAAVGTGMVLSYEAFQRQSRLAYVRAALTSLDNRVRFMAMQPYAYECGTENGQAATAGVTSCRVRPGYFDDVSNVALAGTPCPDQGGSCGFQLVTTGVDAGGRPYGFYTADVPDATGTPVTTGYFNYRLNYQGTDFALRPGGVDLDGAGTQVGMVIPREVLQSEFFDCAVASGGATPIFQGFDTSGRPSCRAFTACAPGSSVGEVDFARGTVTCHPLGASGTLVDCASPGTQRMIGHVNWQAAGSGSAVASNPPDVCAELPAAPVAGGSVVTGGSAIDGQCGSSHNQNLTASPTTNLCLVGTASAVTGTVIDIRVATVTTEPWTWTCSGSNGGATANCSTLSVGQWRAPRAIPTSPVPNCTVTDNVGGSCSPRRSRCYKSGFGHLACM